MMKCLDKLADALAAYYKAERDRIRDCRDPGIALSLALSLDEAEKADRATLAAARRLADNILPPEGNPA